MFCSKCGNEINDEAVVCIHCGCAVKNTDNNTNGEKHDWLVAMLLCWFLGGFGAHRFYSGHIGTGSEDLFYDYLTNVFYNQINDEHTKIKKISKEIKKQPNNYDLYLQRADAKLQIQGIFNGFINIFCPYNKYKIFNAYDIKKDLNKAKNLKSDIDIDLRLGFIEFKNNHYQEAVKLLSQYIESNPNDSDVYLAYYYRGISYDEMENVENAISDLNASIKLNPKFSKSYTALGNIYIVKIGNAEKAFQYYDKAKSLNPDDIENYLRKISWLTFYTEAKENVILREYNEAINTQLGKYCCILYWTISMSDKINPKLRIENAIKHYNSTKRLSDTIKSCKYCVIPDEYRGDIKNRQWDDFYLLINSSLADGDEKNAKKYYEQCKRFALINFYGRMYCPIIDES